MKIQELLAVIPQRRVLVIGDAILDVAYVGRALGSSVENPAVTTYAHERIAYSFGGASLVVRNLLALGAAVDYVTVLGDDANLEKCRALSSPRLRFNTKIIEPGRTNTVKERFWAEGKLVFRWDFRDDREIWRASQDELLTAVAGWLAGAVALVVADYRHGVLTSALIPKLLAAAKAAALPAYIDSQVAVSRPSNHRSYHGADVFCLNLKEARAVEPSFDAAHPEAGLRALQKELRAAAIVVKLADHGSVALIDSKVIPTPAFPVKAADVTGAGDAFLAALAVVHGAPWDKALQFANLWAGLSTTVEGPNPPTLAHLKSIKY